MRFEFGFILLISVSLMACNKQKSVQVPDAYKSMSECNQSSKIEELKFIDLEGDPYSVYWTDAAARTCPGPGYPRLMIRNPKVTQWIQIITVNITPPNKMPYIGPSWNLTGKKDEWTFLDVLPNKAEEKHMFYNDEPSPNFHDNPAWSGRHPNGRKWSGRLWGFTVTENAKLTPVLSLNWGFTNDPGEEKPRPIRPSTLSPSTWQHDKELLNQLISKWNIKNPF